MNDLVIKEVNFLGDTLIAAKDENGNIWAGVKWFCDGLGLTDGQAKSERKKLQDDLVLSQGTKFHPLGRGNANKEVLCLSHDFVPLWLAKITITPSMKDNNPELVNKLIKYQLQAKDVLAAAFLPKQGGSFEDIMIAQLQEQKKLKESVRVIDKRVDKLENTMTIDYAQQKELRNLSKSVVISLVGGKKSLAYTYQYPKQSENDKPPKLYGTVVSRIWHDFQDYFGVNSYNNTPVARFDEAKQYLNNWNPPINMQLEIGKINRGEM